VRIGRVRATEENGRVRSEATISWEESDRPRAEIFFEASPRRGGASSNDANAFLAAAAIPAFRHGERRIAVEGAVCPRLRDGIAAATALVGSWYGHAAPAPVIEPSGGFSPPSPPPAPRAGVLASGGADSIFSILRNRTELAPSHPLAFREALRVRHLMFPVDSTPERREHIERRSAASVAAIARAAGLEITEITTNATVLEDDFEAFAKWTHGSVLASCAIAAGAPLADATISASHDVRTSLKPWGSHPLIDPEFGTAAVEIHHEPPATASALVDGIGATIAAILATGEEPLKAALHIAHARRRADQVPGQVE